ncbi:MAG: hypothetical protein ACLP9L_39655, partial [Thermoguttaceae bacterium]
WAEDYLTHLTAAAGAKFRKQLPDVAKMTAAQLQQALYDLQQRQGADAAAQQAFDQQRNQQVAAIRQRNLQRANANAEADVQLSSSGGGSYPSYSSGVYAPLRYQGPVYGGVGYPGPLYDPIYPRYVGGWRW